MSIDEVCFSFVAIQKRQICLNGYNRLGRKFVLGYNAKDRLASHDQDVGACDEDC